MNRHVTVGLLLPPEVAPSAAMSQFLIEEGDDLLAADVRRTREVAYSPKTEELMAELREALLEAADQTNTHVSMHEYQIHRDAEAMGVKRRRQLASHDILAALNPTPMQSALFVRSARPTQRLVVGFTHSEDLVTAGGMIAAGSKIPLFTTGTRQAVSRAFMMAIPPNDDLRASEYRNIVNRCADAMVYPHVSRVLLNDVDRTSLWVPVEVE